MAVTGDDNFTGTASTTLQSHSPDSGGGTWTQATGSTGNAVLDGSGHVYDQFVNGPWYYNSQTPASADYDVQVKSKTNATGDNGLGPIARQSTSADTHYRVFFHGGVGDWLMYKNVGGIVTGPIGNYTGDIPTTERDTLLSVSGGTQTFKIATVTRISASDTAISAAGKAGIYATGSNSSCYSDYWSLQEAGAVATPAGVSATAAIGTSIATGAANATPSGVSVTASLGTVVAAQAVGFFQRNVFQNNVFQVVAASGSTAAPAGVSTTASVGTATATGAANTLPTGVSSTAAIGTAIAGGAANTAPASAGTTASVGTAAATGAANALPSGVATTASVGTAIADGGATSTAFPLGVQVIASVGFAVATGDSPAANGESYRLLAIRKGRR